jgi:ParB-like chromosome segregation protein Spo0J/DNA modification methylase
MLQVHAIPREAIRVAPDRMRKEFNLESLAELARSIRLNGLIHPITVERNAEGYNLLTGERRFRSIELLEKEPDAAYEGVRCGESKFPPGTVPCILREELTKLELLRVEYSENVDRDNLTWQEQAVATERLHELELQFNPQHTIAATAAAIYGARSAGAQNWNKRLVSEQIILAKHLSDPEVVKAKTQVEALKVVRKKAEAQHRAQLAAKFDLSKTPHRLIFGDLRQELLRLPDGEYDVMCTDPPYGVSAHKFGSQADAAHTYEDSPEYFKEIIRVIVEQATRICKPAAHAYVFVDWGWFEYVATQFDLDGWTVWHRPFVWDKGSGMLPSPDYGPKQTYELILYAYRGERKVVQQAMPDVLRHPSVARPRRGAEKPAALYKDLLQRSCRPGDKVIDCCAGTGPILPAATDLKLIATAIEREQAAYDLAVTRLSGEEKIDAIPDIVI